LLSGKGHGSTYGILLPPVMEPWKAYWIQAGSGTDNPGTDYYDLIVP